MSKNKMKKEIQAVLFAIGEPVEKSRLMKLFSLESDEVEKIIDEINLDYENMPFQILKLAENYQMTTKTEYSDLLREVLHAKNNAPLSQAALEILAIVAYNQPVTRAFIEQVRGIDSGTTITSLMNKGLIAEAGRLEIPGRPIAYKTTSAFLRCFGMKNIEALPKIPQREFSENE